MERDGTVEVSDYKDEIDRLNRELQEVKKKFYDQKKREMIQQERLVWEVIQRFGRLLTKLEWIDGWMDRNGKGQLMSCCKSLVIPVGYDNNSWGFSCWLHHSSQ